LDNADSLDIGALAEDANLSHQIEQSRQNEIISLD